MKCAQCGFPLAPVRKVCPRCGTQIAQGQSSTLSRELQDVWPVQEPSPGAGAGGMYSGMEALQQGQGGQGTPNSWNAQAGISVQQILVSQQLTHNPYTNTLEQHPSPPTVPSGNQKTSARSRESFPQAPHSFKKSNANGRSSRLSFMVSGLCVITGGLILIFVYFTLPLLKVQPPTGSTNGLKPVLSSPTSVSTQPALSPTPPGQRYIDNVQLASKVDPIRAQPLQVTTNFKVNQRMNVTFSVHPEGHSGTVCLLWYMNGSAKPFSNYPLSVGLSSGTVQAYAYTTVLYPGSGYVALYWGHIPSCTDPDKLLAQRVSFTASA